jgi:hypothetical protein
MAFCCYFTQHGAPSIKVSWRNPSTCSTTCTCLNYWNFRHTGAEVGMFWWHGATFGTDFAAPTSSKFIVIFWVENDRALSKLPSASPFVLSKPNSELSAQQGTDRISKCVPFVLSKPSSGPSAQQGNLGDFLEGKQSLLDGGLRRKMCAIPMQAMTISLDGRNTFVAFQIYAWFCRIEVSTLLFHLDLQSVNFLKYKSYHLLLFML